MSEPNIAILEPFIGRCHDRKCKGDMQPDGTVLSYRLLTPSGHKLLVTRAEATTLATDSGWSLQDNTHG
jgi:hypothetical protein